MARNTAYFVAPLATVLMAAPVAAQTIDQSAGQAGANSLEVIVVTAQKRSENLQEVPIAITAITALQLERTSINNTMDLTFATPGLNVSQTTTFVQPFIRGVGTDSFSPGNEASVATYVDGVYIASMNAGTFGFNNVERIEVLKGPQGTLYGRNSTGGLINVITRTPGQEFQFKGSASYANFETFEGKAYVAGGIGPGLAADLAVNYRDQGKGYYRNLATGKRLSEEEGIYLRSKVVADLGPDIRLILSGDYSDFDNTLANTRQPARGSTPALPSGSYSTVPGDYSNTFDALGHVEDWGVSGNLSVDLGAVRLVSITAYRHTTGEQYLDGDDSAVPFSDIFTAQLYKQFTQELQIMSAPNDRFEWILGAYYLDGDAGWNPISTFANGRQAARAFLFSTSRSFAGFGQATIGIGDNGKLTLGARYTHDEKDYRRSTVPGGGRVESSWNRPTWRASYSQQLTDRSLLYASYNRGYKSGVYNTLFGPPLAVNPEVVDSFEIGSKNDLFDRRLRFNVAAFYTNFKDIQVRSQQPGNASVSLQNAASARIYGLDADVYAVLSDELELQFGLSYINARYTDFARAEIYVPSASGGNRLTVGDASGNPLPRTPEISCNAGLTYDHRLDDDSRIYGSANVYLTGNIPWEPSNRLVSKGYGIVSGAIGYAFPGDHFSIELFGRNLTNTTYENYVVPSANADRISYAQPRTYGVRLGAKF